METQTLSWAIEIPQSEDISSVFIKTLKYIGNVCENANYIIYDIELNTQLPTDIIRNLNRNQPFVVKQDFIRMIFDSEETQLIELDLLISCNSNLSFKLIVRDGFCYNILGKGIKPSFLGSYSELDTSLFNW